MKNVGIGTWIHRRRVKSAEVTAIIDGDIRRSYAELAERIDRLASALADRGVGRGDRIAYLGGNSAPFLETLFAAGTLGAIFVPLNTRLATAELRFQLEDSGARLLLHAQELSELVDAIDVPKVAIGERPGAGPGGSYEDVIASGAAAHRDVEVTLDDPALILYTSGTTGRPKGAVLSHGSLTWNAYNVLVDYDVTSREVALMVSPLFHVASLGMGALPTLLKGGTLVLQSRFDAGAVLAAIEEHRITSLSGVPTTFQMLAEHPLWASTDISSLTKVTCGGSPIPARVAAAYEARGLAFSSGYGMTEAAPGATSLSPRHSSDHATTSGLAHFFSDVRIVDESGTDVPTGVRGEVLVSGPNLMLGYWNAAEQRPDRSPDGWFASGDIGFVDSNGFLTIADRAKDMIISGGENIYPAEVEQLLLELDAIAEVAVIGEPDPRWGEVGVAIVVPAQGSAPELADLAAHLDGRIARYKIPKRLVLVAELPRTATGKVRKHDLRERYIRHLA